MFKGFKNFLMRGDVIVLAVGLIVALAFSTLIKSFTDFVINPIIARAQGSNSAGLGWQLGQGGNKATYLDIGSFISAVIYFIIFMAVVYFLIVVPYTKAKERFFPADEAGTPADVALLEEIRDLLKVRGDAV